MRELATLQRKTYSETEVERRLATALRGRGGAITRADATALTGLPLDQTEGALKTLLGRYRSHLAVTDQGELLYTFDPSMTRRDAVTLGEHLRAAGTALWKGFTVLFKIAIAVTLVVYVAAFLAMLIALVFARSASDRDNDRDDRGGGGFGFPWIWWWIMPDMAPPDVQRRRAQRRRGGPQKRLHQSVFDFVFGPSPAAQDPGAAEREVVAFLRAHDGRITATDLVALTGWSYARAEEEATRLLADYDGEPEVTDDGTIVYTFPSLRRTAGGGALVESRWRHAWMERRTLTPLTGNTSGTDAAIGIMNAFNMVGGAVIGPAFLMKFALATPALVAAVTWFPLAFSSVFFAVPAGRWLKQRRAEGRLAREVARAELVREVIEARGGALDPQATVARVAGRTRLEPALVGRELERLLRDLDGDVATDAGGAMRYAFPRVTEELAAAERVRALAPAAEEAPGEVVFSSDDEPPSLADATRPGRLPPRA